MIDTVSLERVKFLHPAIIDRVRVILADIERLVGTQYTKLRITDGFRSIEEQDEKYKEGRTILYDKNGKRMGIVTNAKGGRSYHNYGLAVDICILVDRDRDGTFEYASWDTKADWNKNTLADWKEIVAIFKKYGFEWGGDWKGNLNDTPHFQYTFGYRTTDLLSMMSDPKNVITVDKRKYPKIN